MEIRCKSYDIELETGETVKLTMNNAALYALRSAAPEAYKHYGAVLSGKQQDVLEATWTVLYTAYLCAIWLENKSTEGAMSFEDFICVLPPEFEVMNDLVAKLTRPKKTTASVDHSN